MDRDIKYSACRDKMKHVEDLATKAEEVSQRQNMKTLYRITNKLSGGYRNVDT